ncbi:unnamed protein product, partial [Rotaria sp. Silwood2]
LIKVLPARRTRTFNKESASYICNELNISNDVVYGSTKLFIKQPISLFELENKRTEGLQSIVVILQKHVRSWKQFRIFHREISAIKIQNFYRKYRAQSYINQLNELFNDRLGKNIIWPKSRSSFITINNLLKQIYQRWRIKQIEQTLPIELRSTFELKLLASKYLQQRPLFFDRSIYQEWKGDYLAQLEENSRLNEYQKSINELRTKDNFNRIIFSTFAIKV